MKSLFVDTSGLIALGNAHDKFHKQSALLFKECIISKKQFVTTNAVILELTNAFSAVKYKPIAIRLVELIYGSKDWSVVIVDKILMDKGIKKFKQMNDKDWGVVDCISMIVAESMDINEIFTNDHHFEQAGFTILLK
ncbi:MAG: hypothetical protein BWK80_30945 [Desulfobacteraceae bacterium IS3]|nr:MAG: hypothetical protein BWK80_30945 [Desulfobacteraceae bacterium IS3]HAO19429.1 PIN domain-containing protein [Desulfobacteraceae bacterium]